MEIFQAFQGDVCLIKIIGDMDKVDLGKDLFEA